MHGMTSDSSKKQKVYKARDAIYSSLTRRYENSAIVKHFYNADNSIPLWAIFEELILGELSVLIEVLNDDVKLKISSRLGCQTLSCSPKSQIPKMAPASINASDEAFNIPQMSE